jgi:hypothetical protein
MIHANERVRRHAMKRLLTLPIVALVVFAASCTGGAARPDRASEAPMPPRTDTIVSRTTPTATSTSTQISTPTPSAVAGEHGDGVNVVAAAERFLTTEVGERWIRERGGSGESHFRAPGGVTLFLVARPEGIGVAIQMAGRPLTTACCLTPVGRGARPLAYVPTGEGRGVLLAHVSPLVQSVTYDCIQCSDAEAFIPRIGSGRVMGVPQFAFLIVRANADGGNDGWLLSFGSFGNRTDEDWIGIPPACTSRRCPQGLTWGVLQPGTDRIFGP